MKLGAEPKKIALLAGIVAVGIAAVFIGGDDRPERVGDRPRPGSGVRPPVPEAAGPRTLPAVAPRPAAARRGASVQEFKPVLRSRRPEDRIDPTTIDPTLRLDLMRRLANVKVEGGSRTIFDFGKPPAPKQPDPPKIVPKPPGPPPPAVAAGGPQPGAEPAKPAAPPIRLKFYGFVGGARAATKRAFFLEGEDIFVAGEGDVIQDRYKVVRIGLNSVVMEDLQFKNQQTLQLEEPQA